jgi:hypothetical protein
VRNFIFCFFILYSIQVFSQKNQVKELTINNEIYPILKSLYGKIEVVDNRVNKEILIENDTTGRFHLKSKYALNPELKIQLEDFYKDNIGSIAQYLNKKVLFVIHDYNVHRESFTNGSLYYLRCSGDLFLQEKGKYLLLKTMDTILISSGGENINNFFNNKSRYIYDFMQEEAETSALDTLYYARNYALNLDSFFKLNNQLYNSKSLTDGVYYSFSRLASAKPNIKFFNGNDIQIPKTLEKFIETVPYSINKDSIYAIVNQGKFYINYKNKMYEGKMDNGEYYFQISFHSKKSYSPAPVLNGGLVGGLLGGLIWYLAVNELTPKEQILLETQLNCRTGQLKPTRQISNHKK